MASGAAHLQDDLVARLAAMPESTRAQAEPHLTACAFCAGRVQDAARLADVTRPDAAAALSVPAPARDAPAAEAAPHPEEEPAASPLLPRGTTVGRYLLLEPVGRGGMGVVYAAYDPKLDRKVALKLLSTGRGTPEDPDARERLMREAQAMARVSHPNVTALHDVGTYEDQVFLAMELVDGVTLRSWLQTHKHRRWREVLKVMVQAGQGLAAAHAAGLVHRDFKPDNILVGRDGRVRVTDFGLARLARASRSRDDIPNRPANPDSRLRSTITRVGAMVGTPAYMAPEQHLGQVPDARSDQFAFCVVLYHALYRKRPFDPRKLVAAVRAQDGSAERVIQPLPLSPPLPVWIKHALQRGLSVSPQARYPSMEALLNRLSRPPALLRYAWVAGLLLLLAAVFGVPFLRTREEAQCRGAERQLAGVWDDEVAARVQRAFTGTGRVYAESTFLRTKMTLDEYARGWVAQHTEACQATRQRGEQSEAVLSLRSACLEQRLDELKALTTELAQADPVVVDKAALAALGLSPLASCEDVATLSAPLGPAAEKREAVARVREALGRARAQRLAGRAAQGLKDLEPVLSRARKLSYPPLLGAALAEYGLQLRLVGRADESERALLEAWESFEAGHDDQGRASAAVALVRTVGYDLGRPEEGLRWGRLAQALLVRLNHPPELEVVLGGNLAVAQYYAGRYAEARAAVEPALALATGGERIRVLDTLGLVLQAEGNYARAVEVTREAVALCERLNGPDHPTIANELNNLAYSLFKSGDYKGAQQEAEKALAVAEKALGPEHPLVGGISDTLGGILTRRGQHAEALKYEFRALLLAEKLVGPKHERVAAPLDNIGYAYLQQGDAKAALPYFERALSLPSVPADLRADIRFHTAQALWRAGTERARAKALAAQAREEYAHQGRTASAEAVAAWQKAPGR